MIGIIGGTGLDSFEAGTVSASTSTPYGDTSHGLVESVIDGVKVYFLARHGNPHHIPPHKVNYRANIWALREAGVKSVVAVNAVGGISSALPAGSFVIPDQLIDYSYDRAHTYSDGVSGDLMHVDFTQPYSENVRQALVAAFKAQQLDVVNGGVQAVTQGPRLETAAEIDRLERDGCHVVGMTGMPEAALARELDLDYACVCLVVNPAAGRSERLITMEDIHAVVEEGMVGIRSVLKSVVGYL